MDVQVYRFWELSVLVCQWSAGVTRTPCLLAGHLLSCHWTLVACDLVWLGTLARFRALPHIFLSFSPLCLQIRHLALNSAQEWLPPGSNPWFVTQGAGEMSTPAGAMGGSYSRAPVSLLLPLSPLLCFLTWED